MLDPNPRMVDEKTRVLGVVPGKPAAGDRKELPEDEPYDHDWMTLEMVIDDWSTWEELWEEDVTDQGSWVQ